MTDRVDQLLEDILDGPAALERLLGAYDSRDTPLAQVMPALPMPRSSVSPSSRR